MPQLAYHSETPRARRARAPRPPAPVLRSSALALAPSRDGIVTPMLAGVSHAFELADCPGSSEDLAAAMITTGIADPRRLTPEGTTDAFVTEGLDRWMRRQLGHPDLAEAVCLTCEVERDNATHTPAMTLTLEFDTFIDWRIGPFVRALAARSPTAASTVLTLIELQPFGAVYGPRRTAMHQEFLADMETDMRKDEDEDDRAGGNRPPKPAPPFDDLLTIRPFPRDRTVEGLRPYLDPQIHDAVTRLLRADAANARHAKQGPPDQADGNSPPLFCLFEAPGDATIATFDDEMQGWMQESGPALRLLCGDMQPETIARAFAALRRALRVIAALDALARLTTASGDQAP